MGSASVIWAENLAKRYDNVIAVDGLSLEVREGEIMGLIGPNGAGKTTTIKMILGLLKPDRGQVRVFDEDPWDNTSIRSRIGVIHERAYFPPHHRVLDYLERVCRIFGEPVSRAREVLALLGLEYAYDRTIKGLSAGMLQRFAIAHALINSPGLIVADEPTSNLDPQARGELLDLILRLHREEKATFLISSHILPELSRVCERVAIIHRGRVWASGAVAELSERLGAKAARVLTDKPEPLAAAVRRLDYVRRVDTNGRGILVNTEPGKDEQLFEDVLRLAKGVEAKIMGMESEVASLEELFRLAIKSSGGSPG